MPDYTKAKRYSLVSDVDNEVYVGSTCSDLKTRFSRHKACSKTYQTRRVYAHIAATGGWDNWRIVLVEAVPCKNSDELYEHERRHIKLVGTLNTIMPPDCAWRRSLSEKIDESRLASAAVRDANPEEQMNHSCEMDDIYIVVPSCENPEKQVVMNSIGQKLSKMVMELQVRKDPKLYQFALTGMEFIIKELELRAARRDIAKIKAYDMHMY